ncbi:formate dehydrogenase accessory sulfurtransferase FdhD [Nemorincola caseinilytica]
MQAVTQAQVKKITGSDILEEQDMLATEEPLEIRLSYYTQAGYTAKSISVTMRTPGNDLELAKGFLYTEGIISSREDVTETRHASDTNGNVVYVTLAQGVMPDIVRLERNFYTTSSCGVCGKASIEAVRTACNILDTKDHIEIPHSTIYTLPATLRAQQSVFEHTGGLHGCAIFDTTGNLVMTREDVGRHNALDKLIGAAIDNGLLPLNDHILLLSGRASFELVQKAAMAGIKVIAAVGAPSSLAVQLADEWGMTLVGFLRGERFNIYTGAQRIVI